MIDQEIQKQSIPWAERKEIGVFKALWETIKQVLFKPAEFFNNLEIKDTYLEPLSFYFIVCLIITSISLIVTLFWDKLFLSRLEFSIPMIIFLHILLILLMVVFLYISSTLFHLCVLIFKGKGSFKGTFNVLAYKIPVGVFSQIPLIGTLISGIWDAVVGVIGFKRVHKLTTIKAIFAYLVPYIVAIIVLIVAIAIPNLLRVRLSANEALAEASVRTISAAIENYRTVNERYPSDEYDLVYAQPPYLSRRYDNKTISGYRYSLSFSDTGYEVIAEPKVCGTTGIKIFRITTGGIFSEENCK